jgi:hypothetical protein
MSNNGVMFGNNQGPVTIVNNGTEQRRATVIGKLIEIIASGNDKEISLDRVPAEIDQKINFNNLKEYRWLIEEYVSASLFVGESINQLNRTILNGSTKLKIQMNVLGWFSCTQ